MSLDRSKLDGAVYFFAVKVKVASGSTDAALLPPAAPGNLGNLGKFIGQLRPPRDLLLALAWCRLAEIDNNAAERAIRGIALGRKN